MARLLRYGIITICFAVVYLGWVFGSRYLANRRAAHDGESAARLQVPAELNTADLKILQFYARPAQPANGSPALLCYGVLNAKHVRIEPDVEAITPALTRCVEVAPSQDTTYTLTATAADGRTASASVRLQALR